MNKKYDDFFDDLDKTTDLLKAFKPHMEGNQNNDIDSLFKEFNKTSIQSQTNIPLNQNINNEKEFEQYEQQYKQQIEEIKRDQQVRQVYNIDQSKQSNEFSALQNDISNSEDISDLIFQEESKQNILEKEQQKADLTQIIEKMNETVLVQKEEQKRKQQEKIERKKQKGINKNEQTKDITFSRFEKVFCVLSACFIVFCIFVYNSNTSKNNNNNKSSITSFTNAIGKSSSIVYDGDGLYLDRGEYIYKGKNVNNYVLFSNFTWRIIKTNSDGTIDLVLDDYINTLKWNNTYTRYVDSDIDKYLNEYFIKYIDTSYLEKITICLDEVNDLKSFSCNEIDNDKYVRLLTLKEFNDSKNDDTYISDEKSTLWLSTTSQDKVWLINGLNLTIGEPTRMLGIKPVVKLKADINLISGDGTKQNPYIFTEKSNEVQIGDRIKLDNDTYIVYDMDDDTLSLVLDGILSPKYRFSLKLSAYAYTDQGSMAYYLNHSFYDNLPYKDLLVNKLWNTGNYVNGYEDIYLRQGHAKVGLYDVSSLKFNNELDAYYLMNSDGTNLVSYDSESTLVERTTALGIRPAICIKKNNIVSGSGVKEDPYILER